MSKDETLKKLHKKWLQECTCRLRYSSTQGVPGDGNANAQIVFIGEAPGAKEDKDGRPFVGSAGKFLSEMLESIKIKTLLYKPEAFIGKHTPDFVGFSIPNSFVVGYGLDYNEHGRNTEHIYQLKG